MNIFLNIYKIFMEYMNQRTKVKRTKMRRTLKKRTKIYRKTYRDIMKGG